MFERELHAETRSHLYQPFDSNGVPQGGYDSADRLRKALRGELSSDGGYTATGGGSITTPIALPDTDASRTYDLDGLGNWKQSDYIPVGGAATIDLRQHNKLNEITSRKVGDDTKVLFAYDGTTGASNGNLANDGTLQLSYDAFNRLIQVKRKSDGATIGQYVYDALNRRTRKTTSNGGLSGDIPNGTTDYLYQDWQVIEERNSSDTTIKQYVWGNYIDECIQLRTYVTSGAGSLPAGLYYPLQDLLYRTKALTDSSGEIVEAYDYDAYGNTLIFSATGTDGNWWADDATQASYSACEVLFCGYRYDPECKTYQVRNREYNPQLGRWIQRDPIGFDAGDWNLYVYISSIPIDSFDPYGLDWLDNTANFTAGWGDTLTFGATDLIRGQIGANEVLDYDSGWYHGGEVAGTVHGLAFGGAGAGRNALYAASRQGLRRGAPLSGKRLLGGMKRVFRDDRSWGAVRGQWSRRAGKGVAALKNKGQELHHWMFPQRAWRNGVPRGIINAGFNYLPVSRKFNNFMNASTRGRRIVEHGFRVLAGDLYLSPSSGLWRMRSWFDRGC